MEIESPVKVRTFKLVKLLSKWLLGTLLFVWVAACDGERAADDSVDLSSDVAVVLEAIHSNGTDPSTIVSQLESLALLDAGDPDEFGWEFSSVTTIQGVKKVSAEFQSNAPGVEPEWSFLALRIVLDDSADTFEALTAKLANVFDGKPVELSATRPRRLIWQMSGYREALVAEIPDLGSVLVEYGVAQGEAE